MSFMLKIFEMRPSPWLMARKAEGHLTTYGGGDVTTEAETGVMQPQAKGCKHSDLYYDINDLPWSLRG